MPPGRYEYDLKDHLGNVRATVAPVENENTTQVLTPELVQGSGRSANWQGVVSNNIISLVNNKIEVKTGVELVMLDAHYRMEQGREYTITLQMPSNSKPPVVEYGIWDGNNLMQKFNAPASGGTNNYTYIPLATGTYRLLVQVLPQPGTNPVRITGLSVTRRGTTTWQVVQRDDYYPFGMTFNSYTSPNVKENLYKYVGNEEQPKLDMYDFNARFFDSALGRFCSIDPLASYEPGWTPYRYAFNNPLRYSDPAGLLEADEIMNIFDNAPNGKSVYDSNGNCTCGFDDKPPCPNENQALILGGYAAMTKTIEQVGEEIVKKGSGATGQLHIKLG